MYFIQIRCLVLSLALVLIEFRANHPPKVTANLHPKEFRSNKGHTMEILPLTRPNLQTLHTNKARNHLSLTLFPAY